MHIDDAAAFIVDCIRNPRPDDGYPNYGYDVWLPKVIVAYIKEVEHSTEYSIQNLYNGRRRWELSPFFYDAAWGLCRRGVLRPGSKDMSGAGPVNGASAEGYNLTAVGRSWIEQGAPDVFLVDPTVSASCLISYRRGLVLGFCSEPTRLCDATGSVPTSGAAPCVGQPLNRFFWPLPLRRAETRELR